MGIKNFVNTYEYPINKIIISSPLLKSVFGILLLLVLIFKILNSSIISSNILLVWYANGCDLYVCCELLLPLLL